MSISEDFPIGSIWFWRGHPDQMHRAEWRMSVTKIYPWKDFDGVVRDHVTFDVIPDDGGFINGRILRGDELTQLVRDDDNTYRNSDEWREHQRQTAEYWKDKIVHLCRDGRVIHGPAISMYLGEEVSTEGARTTCGVLLTDDILYRRTYGLKGDPGAVNCVKCRGNQ